MRLERAQIGCWARRRALWTSTLWTSTLWTATLWTSTLWTSTLWTVTLWTSTVCGQDPPVAEIADANAGEPGYPDKVTPSDVYAKADLLERCLDQLMERWGKGAEDLVWTDDQLPHMVDLELRPMHAYQVMLVCASQLQRVAQHPSVNSRPLPTLASTPTIYAPRDVELLLELMIRSVRSMADKLGVTEMPTEVSAFTDKTPTDVVKAGVRILSKTNAILGSPDLTPAEVLSQMRRITADVRSILQQTDPHCRYRIDRPDGDRSKQPSDVFQKCIDLRRVINGHARALRRSPTPLPKVDVEIDIRPRDVFLQTQIIIAELNLLKLDTKTVSSTPLSIPSPSTSEPPDVYQEALMAEYLLRQVDTSQVARPPETERPRNIENVSGRAPE